MNINDLLFPDYLRFLRLKNNNVLGCGYTYIDNYYDQFTERTYQTPYYYTEDLYSISLADFDSEVNTINNPLKKPVFTLANGLVFTLYIYYNNNQFWIGFRFEYNGVEIYPLVGAAYGSYSATFLPQNEVFLKQDGVRVGVYTDYSTRGIPIPGVTTPTQISCKVFAGGYNGDILQPCLMAPNSLENEYFMDHFGSGYFLRLGYITAFGIQDLEAFSNWCKTQGDGYDKDIYDNTTPDDDESRPGGGGGQYDPSSDPIDFPDLPVGGAFDTGVIKAFLINKTNLQVFQSKIWDTSFFDIETTFQKLTQNPLDCLIRLLCLPFAPTVSSNANVYLGNFNTTANGSVISNQYTYVDCGAINTREQWGSFLDYSPYTQVSLYLPFIGIVSLKTEDVQKSTIHIKYLVDIATGDCIAFVKCGQSVLYSFNGNMAQDVPVTSYDRSSGITKSLIGGIGSIATGNVMGGAFSMVDAALTKAEVQRAGNLSGNVGLLGNFKPFLIWHRPKQSLAKDFKKFSGYPSNITYQLSSLSGYTEVESIHLEGITNASDEELAEIEALLKSGVIL